MTGDDTRVEVSLVRLRDEVLELSVGVPVGWYIEEEIGVESLFAVADDDALQVGPIRPWLRVTRTLPMSWPEIGRRSGEILQEMSETRLGFTLLWSREDEADRRVIRVFEFEPRGLGQPLRVVQAFLGGPAVVTVEATMPALGVDLEDVFVAIVESVVQDD